MSTLRPILKFGKQDDGRLVSAEEFAEADFDAPWKHEREDGRLIVMTPSDEGHLFATVPWRDRLIIYQLAHPDIVQVISTEAWIRVDHGTDRIGDIGVYSVPVGPVPEIPNRIPEMMFEVVSPDKVCRERDYILKRSDYQRFGVKEYVIIDRFKQTVTVLTLGPEGYLERVLAPEDEYESPLLPGFSIQVSDVF